MSSDVVRFAQALRLRRPPMLLGLPLLASSALTLPALAADEPTPTPSASALELQQTVISATRTAQPVDQVPSTVSVHTRTDLDHGNVGDIKQLVRYEPGVSVAGAGQRSGLNGFNIRGIDGERILTQVDGVMLPDGFFNGPYAQTQRNFVDPETLKRVEILRGPASVLYGSSAIGGAVSYYTLDAEDILQPGRDAGARLKVGYDSAQRSWLKSASVAGRQGEVDALLHLSQRDGHEQASYGDDGGTGLARTRANPQDVQTRNVLAKLGWDYAEGARLGFTYERYKDDRDQNLLSAVGGPFDNGRPLGFYQARTGNDTLTRERFALEHRFGLDTVWADQVQWRLNHQVAKTDQRTEEVYSPFSRTVLRTRDTTYQDRQWYFDAQADKGFGLGDSAHLLTYGATLKRNHVTGARSGEGRCLKVGGSCRAVGADSPQDRLVRVSDFPSPVTDTYALFVQDEIRWQDWTFLPGLRYEHTRQKPRLTEAFLRGVLKPGEPAISEDVATKVWHRVTPKLGVTYAFDEHYTAYGQYAEGFRTPTAKAMYGRFENLEQGYSVRGNPDLRPETSKGVEVGLRGRFDAGSLELALFHNRYRDFINEDAVKADDLGTTFQANNIRRATIKGAELKGRLNLDVLGAPKGLYSQASLAYAHGRNEDNGQPLNSVNPLTAVLGVGYAQEAYGAQLSWTLVKRKSRVDDSAYFAPDGGQQFRTPGYGVLDLTGYYQLSEGLTLSAGLFNLTDKRYWQWDDVRSYDAFGESAVTQPANLDRLTMPGRNIAVNLVWEI